MVCLNYACNSKCVIRKSDCNFVTLIVYGIWRRLVTIRHGHIISSKHLKLSKNRIILFLDDGVNSTYFSGKIAGTIGKKNVNGYRC